MYTLNSNTYYIHTHTYVYTYLYMKEHFSVMIIQSECLYEKIILMI